MAAFISYVNNISGSGPRPRRILVINACSRLRQSKGIARTFTEVDEPQKAGPIFDFSSPLVCGSVCLGIVRVRAKPPGVRDVAAEVSVLVRMIAPRAAVAARRHLQSTDVLAATPDTSKAGCVNE
jgi:hypothetical protein